MQTIGERLLFLRQKANLTMPEIEKLTKISKSNISKYEKNKVKPSADALILLSRVFNITTDWILTGETQNVSYLNKAHYVKKSNINKKNVGEIFLKLLPKHQERILERIETYLEEYEDDISISEDYAILNSEALHDTKKADFILTVKNNSMEPDIKKGSVIYVRQAQSLENGAVAIVVIDSTLICKKFYKINGNIELRPINPLCDSTTISVDNKNFCIIGEVINI